MNKKRLISFALAIAMMFQMAVISTPSVLAVEEHTISSTDTESSFTRGELIYILWEMLGNPKPSAYYDYTDVEETSTYYEAIYWAVSVGVAEGTADNTFLPGDAVSRAQAIKYLYLLAGEPEVSTTATNPFTDIEGHWASYFIVWAASEEIIPTDNDKFAPDDTITEDDWIEWVTNYISLGPSSASGGSSESSSSSSSSGSSSSSSSSSSSWVATGPCGDAVDLNYNSSSETLVISGSGAMYDYDLENLVPWYDWQDEIEKVIISDGVTRVGNYAFFNCDNLTSVTIYGLDVAFGENLFDVSDIDNVILYGYEDSTTESYATQHDMTFYSISADSNVYDIVKSTAFEIGTNYEGAEALFVVCEIDADLAEALGYNSIQARLLKSDGEWGGGYSASSLTKQDNESYVEQLELPGLSEDVGITIYLGPDEYPDWDTDWDNYVKASDDVLNVISDESLSVTDITVKLVADDSEAPYFVLDNLKAGMHYRVEYGIYETSSFYCTDFYSGNATSYTYDEYYMLEASEYQNVDEIRVYQYSYGVSDDGKIATVYYSPTQTIDMGDAESDTDVPVTGDVDDIVESMKFETETNDEGADELFVVCEIDTALAEALGYNTIEIRQEVDNESWLICGALIGFDVNENGIVQFDFDASAYGYGYDDYEVTVYLGTDWEDCVKASNVSLTVIWGEYLEVPNITAELVMDDPDAPYFVLGNLGTGVQYGIDYIILKTSSEGWGYSGDFYSGEDTSYIYNKYGSLMVSDYQEVDEILVVQYNYDVSEDGKTATVDCSPMQIIVMGDADITRGDAIYTLWEAMGEPDADIDYTYDYVDITSKYYYEAICWALSKGVTAGTTDTTFSPESVISRAQGISYLYSLDGYPTVSVTNPFSDVDENTDYYNAIIWAASEGIISAEDEIFAPNENLVENDWITWVDAYVSSSSSGGTSTNANWEAVAAQAVKGVDYAILDNTSSFDESQRIEIYTAKGLAWLANEVNNGDDFSGDIVALENDIDLYDGMVKDYDISNDSNISATNSWVPIGVDNTNKFNGEFLGQNHSIDHVYIDTDTSGAYGLFGYVGADGSISDITIYGEMVNRGSTNSDFIGGVAAVNLGVIDGCTIQCYVFGGYVTGGVVGMNYGTISNCANIDWEVWSYGLDVGGLVGLNGGSIVNSYNTSSVGGYNCVGGIAGYNLNYIGNCWNSGVLLAKDESVTGGLITALNAVDEAYTPIVENCFYLEQDYLSATANEDEVSVDATALTVEELSGADFVDQLNAWAKEQTEGEWKLWEIGYWCGYPVYTTCAIENGAVTVDTWEDLQLAAEINATSITVEGTIRIPEGETLTLLTGTTLICPPETLWTNALIVSGTLNLAGGTLILDTNSQLSGTGNFVTTVFDEDDILPILNQTYTGAEVEPSLTINSTVIYGKTFVVDISTHEITYEDNANPGTATVTLTKGEDVVTKTFEIVNVAPKFWVVGGKVDDNGKAIISVVLESHSEVNGGSVTLTYPTGYTLDKDDLPDDIDATVDGEITYSWTEKSNVGDSDTLVTLSFTQEAGASDGEIILTTTVPNADIRNGQLIASNVVIQAPTVSQVVTQEVEDAATEETVTQVVLALDVAQVEIPTEEDYSYDLQFLFAIFDQGKMLTVQLPEEAYTVSFDSNGIASVQLTASYTGEADEIRIFIVDADGNMSPLAAMTSYSLKNEGEFD